NADRLSVCRVSDGSLVSRQIVCGARNFRVGDKVPLALPGAVLPGGMKIKTSKLRGIESEGMLCSAKELGLAEGSAGLLILNSDATLGAPISEIYPEDIILDVEVTPNRPDLLSHFGMARELAALLDVPRPILKLTPIAEREKSDFVRVEASDACPYYTARIIRGVRVSQSPAWLRRRIESAGLRSVNNVVDATNYILLDVGQPLHAFDAARIRGNLIVRRAAANEKMLALDGKEYELGLNDLVIADRERPLVIAGVMGGEDSGVTLQTRDVLLESAFFDSATIRRTSRRLGLFSDSSYRFERGIDPETVDLASQKCTDLILQIAAGHAEPGLIGVGVPPRVSFEVIMRPERCNSLLGMKISQPQKLLGRLGLIETGPDLWKIPSYRWDLRREVDLIEEVCRLAGVQNIPSRVNNAVNSATKSDQIHDRWMKLRQRLAGMGLREARTLTLIDRLSLQYVLEPTPDTVALRNPLSEDQSILRPSLVPGLLRAAEHNFRRGAAGVSLFEIGRVFDSSGERLFLGLVVAGERVEKLWNQERLFYDLFDLKGIIEATLGDPILVERTETTTVVPLICSVVSSAHVRLGRLGQLRKSLAQELGSKGPILVAEIDLDRIPDRRGFQYKPLDRFPAMTRDVAVIAPLELNYQRILDVLATDQEPLLAEVKLFDLFVDPTGLRIPAGKKSLALSLTYRASDRTLTVDEVNSIHARIKTLFRERLGLVLRE
ncbi:MAG: phenylalanine--tRNA ligase subunit beta, partial [Verrucomicrobia bacterium]|nr:phenylalanine--tRNA ligase subunit beta [Verrucomicrobiota bacterium]